LPETDSIAAAGHGRFFIVGAVARCLQLQPRQLFQGKPRGDGLGAATHNGKIGAKICSNRSGLHIWVREGAVTGFQEFRP